MADPFSTPVGPNGPYEFGFPDVLTAINFPRGGGLKDILNYFAIYVKLTTSNNVNPLEDTVTITYKVRSNSLVTRTLVNKTNPFGTSTSLFLSNDVLHQTTFAVGKQTIYDTDNSTGFSNTIECVYFARMEDVSLVPVTVTWSSPSPFPEGTTNFIRCVGFSTTNDPMKTSFPLLNSTIILRGAPLPDLGPAVDQKEFSATHIKNGSRKFMINKKTLAVTLA